MKPEKKTPASRGSANDAGASRNTTNHGKNHTAKPVPKIKRVLQWFAEGRSLNRFEATKQLRDWCLNSTVAEIEGRFRIAVARKSETVPGFAGVPTHCCRYWLEPKQQDTARKILAE